ncbi:MAG: metallophosphoesterase family protein [Spirochaetales bacterium]|nr:metallophosphoesterase family protein [Spirochaetales bacterium]
MKILVLSDIHGNLEALEAVLEDSASQNWEEIWFLGDLAGYGPEPEACYRLLLKEKTLFIPGNHDLYLCGRMSGSFFSNESRKALIMSHSLVSGDFLNHMKELPVFQERKGVLMVHGSVEDPTRDYILGEPDALRNFKAATKKWVLFGHSHIQEYYSLSRRNLSSGRAETGQTLSLKGSRVLINPGSIGQPRDGNPDAAWGILDTRKKEFTFYRTPYNFRKTQEKMEAAGFSEFLIDRLSKGI